MVELMRRLDRDRFDVHVACFHRRGALEEKLVNRVSSIAAFPIEAFGRGSTFRQALAFAKWCRRIKARVVHTCELYSNIFGLPAAALAGVEVRVANRRELVTPDKTRGQLACQRFAYRAAHLVIANSKAAAAQLRSEGVPSRKVRTIANGVDCGAFGPAPTRSGQLIRRVVTVANLRPEKGHDTLIAAAARIVSERPETEFLIVGDGVLRDSLERRVSELGLSRQIRFLGERSDVAGLLASSDVFVLPSRSEACPNSVLEAMAAGLPIVATRVGGVPELIDSGRTGLLVDADRPAELAEAVLDLIDDPQRASHLGRAARKAAERRFSFDRMVSTFEHLYLSELTGRASQQAGCELAAS